MRLPWGEEIAIDLGSANTHICVKDAGVVVREASYIAFDAGGRHPVAVGLEARRMIERDVAGVQVIRPVRGGVVADFDAAVTMLRLFVHQALGRRPIISPMMITSHPDEASQVERRALIDALRSSGGGRVLSVQRALACAIGAGIPVGGDSSRMVIDLGAGVTDIGVIAMGMATTGVTIRYGGDDLNEIIRRAVKRSQGFSINCATAEQIKLHVGTLLEESNGSSMRVEASIDNGGTPLSTDIDLSEVPALLAHGLNRIIADIIWLLDELTPTQQNEIAANGAILTGGGALLEGIDAYFAQKLGIPVRVATDPLSSTILGLESVLNDPQAVSLQGRRFKATSP